MDEWITLTVTNEDGGVDLTLSRAEAVRLAATILARLADEQEA